MRDDWSTRVDGYEDDTEFMSAFPPEPEPGSAARLATDLKNVAHTLARIGVLYVKLGYRKVVDR